MESPTVKELAVNELKSLISKPSTNILLVDCRSNMEYQTNHIRSAININNNRLLRRKLQQNQVNICDLLSKRLHQNPNKDILLQESTPVVVYDQCTDDALALNKEVFAFLIIHLLLSSNRDVKLLKGGFLAFQLYAPELCWENKKKQDEDFVDAPVSEDIDVSTSESNYPKRSAATLTTQESQDSIQALKPLPTLLEHLPQPNLGWQPLSGPVLSPSNPPPTRVVDHLWIGCQADAASSSILRLHGFTHVLNVSVDCPATKHVPLSRFMRLPINDNYTDRILPHFQKAFDFIEEARSMNGRVLVHCSAGISRSATIAIAYLMKYQNMKMKEAYDFIKNLRTAVSPNFNFLGQLVDFETQLSAGSAATIPSPGVTGFSATSPVTSSPNPAAAAAGSAIIGPTRRDRPKCLPFSPYPPPPSTCGEPGSLRRHLKPFGFTDRFQSPTTPSPSTHFAGLDIAAKTPSPIVERRPLQLTSECNHRHRDLSFSEFVPNISLDQVPFQPCFAGLLSRQRQGAGSPSVSVPGSSRQVPIREGVPVTSESMMIGSWTEASLYSSSFQESGRSIVGLLRRTRSYEDIGNQVQMVLNTPCPVLPESSSDLQLDPTLSASHMWTSCKLETHHSNSSLSSGNSHNSNNIGLSPVS